MKSFYVEVKGITPVMHHRMTEDEVMGLLGSKSKKAKDKVERTPRDLANDRVYKTDDGQFYIPAEHFSGAFCEASGNYKRSDNARKSYKNIANSIFKINEAAAILTDKDGDPIKDFEVDVRSAVNHRAGRVAVCRPRFDTWRAKFHVTVNTDLMHETTAQSIFEDAGKTVGVGSYRVAKGGIYGQFQVVEWREIQ